MTRTVVFILWLTIFTTAASAQNTSGKSLLPEGLAAVTPYGTNASNTVVNEIPVTGQPFTKAYSVSTFNKPNAKEEYGLRAQILSPIRKGDVLWISFKARSLESKRETGESFVELRFDQLVAGKYKWPSYLERGISIGNEWTETSIPFIAEKDIAVADEQVIIKFDTYSQRFEMGPVTFINYGPDANIENLPRSIVHYGGDDPSAPWRKAAAERIEKYRKGNLAIKVLDGKGAPVKDAQVEVKMMHNAFTFGTATSSQRLMDTSAVSKIYRDTLLKYFNQVVLENEIKAKNWERFNYAQTSKGVAWLKEHNIPIRGHVMVWPSWDNAGASFAVYKTDSTGLRAAILKRMEEQMKVLKGFFTEWDVVNEPFAHDDFLKILGRQEMVTWFRKAREATPGVKLFLNDYTMFHGEGPASPSGKFYDNIKFLLDNGAPLGAIGEQGHIGGTPPPITKVLERLDYFATLGLPIQISEFDINSNDDNFKARYLRDFLTAIYSHPATIGFVQWGFWEGQHWFPVAALWGKDWKRRANGDAYADLVTKAWVTSASGTTNKGGLYNVRGFTGDYQITVKYKGKTTMETYTLTNKGGALTVNVK